jgi:predicted Zn-dependent protease
MQDYRSLATDLVAALKKQGADACDVYIVTNSRFTTTVRLGKIEKLEQSISLDAYTCGLKLKGEAWKR